MILTKIHVQSVFNAYQSHQFFLEQEKRSGCWKEACLWTFSRPEM